MNNDIAVLTQRMKSAALMALEAGEATVMPFDKRMTALNTFQVEASPAKVIAIVEALDLQIRTNHEMLISLEAKDKVIANDVQIKARLCRESNSLHDRLRDAEKRIAELESRTVTVRLPEVRITIAESRLRNLTYQQLDAYNAGATRAVAKLYQVLAAAGIQVIEGEG